MTWTLTDIQNKVRNITGSPSQQELDNTTLLNYINNYYIYTMPFELKEQITLEFIKFTTLPAQDVYDFNTYAINFLTDQPMCYADGFPLIFYQDPDIFYQDWPQEYAVDALATGDGTTTTFSGGLYSPPLISGSLFITDGIEVIQDNGDGTMTGNAGGSGTINYITGAFSVTFGSAPPSSASIYGKYLGYSPDRPQGVLFFNNQFTFRPVPDQVYAIQMQGYIQPTSFSNSSPNATALQPEWGQLIAYGASLEIFSDRGDVQKYNEYYPIFKRYENVALGRTVQQYEAEQSVERF